MFTELTYRFPCQHTYWQWSSLHHFQPCQLNFKWLGLLIFCSKPSLLPRSCLLLCLELRIQPIHKHLPCIKVQSTHNFSFQIQPGNPPLLSTWWNGLFLWNPFSFSFSSSTFKYTRKKKNHRHRAVIGQSLPSSSWLMPLPNLGGIFLKNIKTKKCWSHRKPVQMQVSKLVSKTCF